MNKTNKNHSKSVQNVNKMPLNDDYNVENDRRALSNLSGNVRKDQATNKDDNIVDNLDIETQKTLLKTFEVFYEQESETMIAVLEESREDIKNSMMDLFYEQERYKEELQKASEGKYTFNRKKENLIPLSEYLKKKRGINSRNSETNSPSDHGLSDKLAVEKYMRKKERQRQAEANRVNREVTETFIENETQKILNKLNGIDISKEKERERQMEKIQAKLKGKPQQRDDGEIATEIIESYQDSTYAYEREKKMQQEKFKARLSAARDRRALSPNGRHLIDPDMDNFSRREKNSQYLSVPSKNVPLVDI